MHVNVLQQRTLFCCDRCRYFFSTVFKYLRRGRQHKVLFEIRGRKREKQRQERDGEEQRQVRDGKKQRQERDGEEQRQVRDGEKQRQERNRNRKDTELGYLKKNTFEEKVTETDRKVVEL